MTKKIKTFQDKQKYTEQDIALLAEQRKRDLGVKTKSEGLILPDNAMLKDDSFDVKEEKEFVKDGKIVTLEDIQAEELAKKEKFTKEFHRQFAEWLKVDHSSDYDFVDFDHSDYLVRIFSMDVSKLEGYKSLEYEYSKLLGQWKLKDVQATDNVFPIVKILKVGKGVTHDNYKQGDIVHVPSSDVIGEDWNPKFLHIMQFQQSKGMAPVIPDGMKQTIPNVAKNWDRYMFVRPWVPTPEDQDLLTYVIPESKVRGPYRWE